MVILLMIFFPGRAPQCALYHSSYLSIADAAHPRNGRLFQPRQGVQHRDAQAVQEGFLFLDGGDDVQLRGGVGVAAHDGLDGGLRRDVPELVPGVA